MPYIKPSARELIDSAIKSTLDFVADASPGEVNYIITRLVLMWLGDPGNVSYEKYALACGVLGNVEDELYRRRVAPYENHKAMENGDVY